MSARWWAFGVWAVVAASAAYWGLRLMVPARAVPTAAAVAPAAAAPRGDLARLFGADAAPGADAPEVPTNSRFQLVGVVAPRRDAAMHEGVALIAVDGKPAKAYRVGAVVEGETVLQSVRTRGATLGPRGGVAQVSLDIPPPPPAATGALPPAAGGPVSPVVPAPSVPMLPPGAVRPAMPGMLPRAAQSVQPAGTPEVPPSPPHQQAQ